MSSNKNDLFGGMFDFNGDGKTTLDEEYLAYKIFEETTKEDNKTDDDYTPTFHSPTRKNPIITPPITTQKVNIADNLSKENYPQRKKALKSSIVVSIITGLFLSILPIALMWATIASYDDKNSAYWFVFLLFFGGGLVVLGIIWSTAGKSISQDSSNLRTLKENYLNLLSDEERSQIHKKKRKGCLTATGIIGAIVAVFIAISVVNSANLSKAYDKAVSLVDSGSYNEAKELFEEIEEKNYHDTAAYISLCEAHIDYDKGRISSAYYDMNNVRFYYLSDEQTKSLNSFIDTLEADYDVYINEKAEADAKAYRDRITNGVPYVGMPESEIKNTSLGAPSSNVRHNYECISGEQYLANLYDFKSGNKTIFTARCVQGKVTEVWDNRNDPIVPYTPKKSTKTDKDDDPYDVNDYSNEEDFYYDHYDDFFDYYDAEDYYNEHHK